MLLDSLFLPKFLLITNFTMKLHSRHLLLSLCGALDFFIALIVLSFSEFVCFHTEYLQGSCSIEILLYNHFKFNIVWLIGSVALNRQTINISSAKINTFNYETGHKKILRAIRHIISKRILESTSDYCFSFQKFCIVQNRACFGWLAVKRISHSRRHIQGEG